MRPTIERFAEAAAEKGFDVVYPFACKWYNDWVDTLPAEAAEKVLKLPSFARGDRCTAIVVGNSKAVWPKFTEWYKQAEEGRGEASLDHPFDAFTKRCLVDAGERTMTADGIRHEYFWSSRTVEGKLVPLQRAAECSGLAYLDHATHLCIHKVFGAWFSLRCVLVVDLPFECTVPPEPAPRLISDDEEARAKVVLQEALALGQTTEAQLCKVMHGPNDPWASWPWKKWVELRDVVQFGKEHRFTDQQIEYHYTKNKEKLRRELFAAS
ncbi:hypothetical protein DIPPA_32631 [Diplonema papillatum]|nr:hypothetical protein DIPPA_11081 [Diplonema papillatum]KAJ9454750.1 hypothetical protein DIPPA_32631 [Diplonema papillatum]